MKEMHQVIQLGSSSLNSHNAYHMTFKYVGETVEKITISNFNSILEYSLNMLLLLN